MTDDEEERRCRWLLELMVREASFDGAMCGRERENKVNFRHGIFAKADFRVALFL